MTENELKLLYVESCFAVLDRAPPIKDGKIDLVKAMGMLAAWGTPSWSGLRRPASGCS